MTQPLGHHNSWRMAIACLMVLVMGGLVNMIGCAPAPKASTQYQCPMHPTYTSDRAADCPICNMAMVPIPGSGPADAAGMAGDGASPSGMAEMPPPLSLADHAAIHIDPKMAAQSGIVSTEVDYGRLTRSFTAVGYVAVDEARVRSVEARTGGWVRFLHVASTGRRVSSGEPMLILESPDMLAAQQEYVAAANALDRIAAGAAPEVRANLVALIEAARSRLELFGLPKNSVDDLVRTRQPQARIPVLAPTSGTVTAKNIVEGQRVEPGMALYNLADLSRVWIEARVFESDLSSVVIGQSARVTISGSPGYEGTATVTQIVPAVDEATRAVVVRLSVLNDEGRLKPGQYADVSFEESSEVGLLAPSSAIMDTGTRKLAFVHRADDHYEPREVTVSAASDGKVIVRSGLAAGDHVVSQATFLIDSESRLKATLEKSTPAGHVHEGE